MTLATNERYVVDKKGKTISVLLDIRAYRRMLEDLEELAAIRAYDAAKDSGDKTWLSFLQLLPALQSNPGKHSTYNARDSRPCPLPFHPITSPKSPRRHLGRRTDLHVGGVAIQDGVEQVLHGLELERLEQGAQLLPESDQAFFLFQHGLE